MAGPIQSLRHQPDPADAGGLGPGDGHHRARRAPLSGKPYRTPVFVFTTDDGLAILLTYGPNRDWQKNLDAARGGQIKHYGRTRSYTNPRTVTRADAAPSVTRLWRPLFSCRRALVLGGSFGRGSEHAERSVQAVLTAPVGCRQSPSPRGIYLRYRWGQLGIVPLWGQGPNAGRRAKA